MYQATCSSCGSSCEVPFRPTGDKPVYCNACFRKEEGSSGGFQRRDTRGFDRRDTGRSSFGGSRQMHQATCTECGKQCEVPFRPTGDKPVLCSDCFGSHKSDGPRMVRTDHSKEQFEQLNLKLDKVIKLLEFFKPKGEIAPKKPKLEVVALKPKKTFDFIRPETETPVKAAKKTTVKKVAAKKTAKTTKSKPVKKK